MLLSDLARASATIAATTSRLEKVRQVAAALHAADEPTEVEIIVFYLAGELRQRRTGLGYAALRDLPAPAGEPSLTVAEVDASFERIAGLAGTGSRNARRAAFAELMARATHAEQRLLAGLVSGELRQGALEGVMVDAIISASELGASDVRRAVMVAGALAPVARAALGGDAAGLAQFHLQVGRPLRPMLAATAPDLVGALERIPWAGLEWKLDGMRVQVHRDGDQVWVFTRTLDDVTARLPEIVETVRALPATSLVLDGEVIALDASGRPRPFQVTASRTGSRSDVNRLRTSVPLTVFFFDALHLDGTDLIGEASQQRWAALERLVPPELTVARLVTADLDQATAFLADAVTRGHEGVVVKSLDATYAAGRRGSGWIKVKPRHTADLVVLAAEWGHGRRTGLLSNLHLGALDPASGELVMLGKTFKGLTDQLLRWQTERLLELADQRDQSTVYVRPELVVEIAFDGVQASTRYPGGMALRFARVVRYRLDKRPAEVDTVDALRQINEAGTTDAGIE